MIHLRPLTPAHLPASLLLCRAANWNQTARDWAMFWQLDPLSSCAAFDDEQLVGTVTTVRYEDRFGWIGMMLVDPTLRRQGVGTMLMRQALELLRDVETVRLDATPVGREVYLKLGFVDEYRLHRMQTVVSGNGLLPSSARLLTPGDWPALHALDRNVFGADRQAVLAWAQADAPEYAWVADGASGIRGYCLGRHGHNFEHLGPVVADDFTTAQQLVSACLGNHAGKSFVLDAASHDATWLQWLTSIGFVEQRPFTRMYRGSNRYAGEPERQFAILGPEFG